MKQIAATIKDIVTSPNMRRVLDRSIPVDDLISPTLSGWAFDLYTRKPAPALLLEDGGLIPTDLDLACFMSALAQRGAVINIPHYASRRPKTYREGELVVSKDNRHGKVLSLSANKEAFSFSVRILDMNVIQAAIGDDKPDITGAPRNFMLVDIDGSWHGGWRTIEFMPNRKENAFLEDHSLWTGNKVVFQNFVHPNRWVSFFGAPYLFTKVLMQRLTEECTFYRQEEKRLNALGITLKSEDDDNRPHTSQGESDSESVKAFLCEVDTPNLLHSFEALPATRDALIASHARVTYLTYTALPQLRFAVRATELAFFEHQKKAVTAGHFPAWIKGGEWKEFQETGANGRLKPTKWNRLVLHQVHPWETGFALRYRVYEKMERVSV